MANKEWLISTQGTIFLKASKRCFEQRDTGSENFEMFVQPGVVCLAFSIELNLKALITFEGSEPRNIHNLSKLFKSLNGKTQNEIIKQCELSNEDFLASLKKIEVVFEEWRYVYEQGAVSLNMNLLHKLSEVLDSLTSDKISRDG